MRSGELTLMIVSFFRGVLKEVSQQRTVPMPTELPGAGSIGMKLRDVVRQSPLRLIMSMSPDNRALPQRGDQHQSEDDCCQKVAMYQRPGQRDLNLEQSKLES